MDRFFDRFNDLPKITISLSELIPPSDAAPSAGTRLIYFPYIKKIVRRSLDDKLRFYRQKALVGALHPADFSDCYNLTTGWSEGIDLQTWDKLNEYYYKAISPTTGEVNLFTKNYNVLLERMLPQFTFSKIKLSEAVLEHKDDNNRLKVLEIGAGSGSFAVDLIMSCKREGKAYEEIDYYGVEPSEYMRGNFRTNTERKIRGTTLPENWELVPGSLEAVDENPEHYLTQDCATVIVFSYCAHHCFHQSLKSFFENDDVKKRVDAIYVLDVTKEHGWTKPYYMWADCESPENFDNVLVKGKWNSETLWLEPRKFLEGHAVTNSWCSLRRLQ